MSETPVIFVTAGTDMHPFERLVRWTEQLADRFPDADIVLQHGTSRPARGARNFSMMDASEYAHFLGVSDLVVAQGGPGGIFEAREHGQLPLVVPRSGDLGEHVDDHQLIFSAMLERSGLVRVARDWDGFLAAVTEMLPTGAGRIPPDSAHGADFERVLTDVVNGLRPLPWQARLRRLWSSARRPSPA